MEDEKIVELFLSRDKNAVAAVSEKYGSRLRAVACRITADEQVAQECENDTYLEVWNRIPPNEPGAYLFPYLSRIIRHIALNRCLEQNRQKRRADITELTAEMEQCLPAPDDVEAEIDGAVLGGIISDFLHTQPREKRIMFVCRYYYLDPVAVIAEKLQVSQSKVKTTLFRMRRDLRQYLVKEGYPL